MSNARTPEELTHRKERRREVHISQLAQRLRARRGFHKATVALAADHARIVWAMLARGVHYRPDTKPTAAEPTAA